MRSESARPVSGEESRLLDDLLAHDFRGVAPLRVQARTVLAAKGCECGCGTVDLVPQGSDLPRSDADSPVPVEGSVLNLDGEEIGGLLLFIRDGLLATFEIFSYDKPMAMPRPDMVRWATSPG